MRPPVDQRYEGGPRGLPHHQLRRLGADPAVVRAGATRNRTVPVPRGGHEALAYEAGLALGERLQNDEDERALVRGEEDLSVAGMAARLRELEEREKKYAE